MIYELLDRAAAAAVADQPRLMAARAAWDRLAGVVHDDEPLFEERAAAFVEWYLLDWRGDEGEEPSPIEGQIAAAPPGERKALAALAAGRRSLFQVLTAFPDGVLLDDLWGGATFRVHERRRLAGLSPGELFEGRLAADLATATDVVFLRTFCFHPREAEPAIRELVERARILHAEADHVLFRLLRLRVRCERYRHVAPARIYEAGEGMVG